MPDNSPPLSKRYLIVVLTSALILPVVSVLAEYFVNKPENISLALMGKWFIFFAVGVRLTMAGMVQVIKPSFTAKEIFHIEGESAFPVVRELGFANICFGLTGLISLFLPQWRIVSAFGSGLYYGIAALNHIIKKPAGANEMVALISDVFVFLVLAIYVALMF